MLECHDDEHSCNHHATTCFMSFVVLPACASHVTLPPNEGGRVSQQTQIERNSDYCFGESPKEENLTISQDLTVPLFKLIFKMAENALHNVSMGRKKHSFKANEKSAHQADWAMKGKGDLKENVMKEFYIV